MRSMKMAALAVAMTLMFSGLALARDNDHDKTKTNMITGTSTTTTTVIMIAIMTGKMITGQIAIMTRERERREREHHWWEREHAATTATIAEARFTTAIPSAIRECVSRRRYLWLSRAAASYPSGGYGYPGSVYGRGGNGKSGAYGFGYQDGSYMARKDISQNKRFNPNPRNEYRKPHPRLQQCFRQTRTTTRPNTATDIPRAMKRTIAADEAGRG